MLLQLFTDLLHLGFVFAIMAEKDIEVTRCGLALQGRLSGFTLAPAIGGTIHLCNERGRRYHQALFLITERDCGIAGAAANPIKATVSSRLHLRIGERLPTVGTGEETLALNAIGERVLLQVLLDVLVKVE